MTEDEMVGWHQQLSDSSDKLQEMVKGTEAWHAALQTVAELVGHSLETEQQPP